MHVLPPRASKSLKNLNSISYRYILNMKQLPYKTVYLEFPDIATVLEQAKVPRNVKRDGSLAYTVPSIIDDTTGIAVSDSFKIAEYLDKQYPETPQAFPLGSIALQAAFYSQFGQLTRPFAMLIAPKIPEILNPVSSEHCRRISREALGKELVSPTGEELRQLWEGVKEVFDLLDGFYSKNGGGPFFMGEIPSFADFILGGLFRDTKALDPEDWERYMTWNGGRWQRLVKSLEKYESTEE